MEFKLRYMKPNPSRAWLSAATMGISYFIGTSHRLDPFQEARGLLTVEGGLLPMIPYFATRDVTHALFISIGITVAILLLFGFFKNYSMVRKKRSGRGAIQTLSVGVIAAGASYGIVYGIDHTNIR